MWKFENDKIELFQVENFLTKESCKKLIYFIDKHSDILKHSTVQDEKGRRASEHRTSKTVRENEIENYEYSTIIKNLHNKICKYMNIPIEYSEQLQIQVYDESNFYKPHYDFLENTDCIKLFGNRKKTFMLYLNDVEEGGETFFPYLNLKIEAKEGKALIWKNLYNDNTKNMNTLHGGESILKGKKYIVTLWFRERQGYMKYQKENNL